MNELKACPFCPSELSVLEAVGALPKRVAHDENTGCPLCDNIPDYDDWQTRPIEDALQAEINRLIELQRKMPLVADRRGAELSHLRAQHTRLIDQCKRLADELLGYVGADGNAPGSVELSNFDRLMKELDV